MKTENITFEDYLFSKKYTNPLDSKSREIVIDNFMIQHEDYVKSAIEFAKYHVELALKEASEKAEMKLLIDEENDIIEEANIDKDTILNAYDLTQIK